MILDAAHGNPTEPVVTIRMTKRQAEWASSGLADMACWVRGFNAALKDGEGDRSPMGLSEIRELNIALKKALEAAE